MPEIDLQRDLPGWLAPVQVLPDLVALESRASAVTALAASPTTSEALVLAAHRKLDAARDDIVKQVVAMDPLFVGADADELLARLAAAAVMVRMNGPKASAITALLVGSADFLDLSPAIDTLTARAAEVVAGSSTQVRTRLSTSRTPQRVREIMSREPGEEFSMEVVAQAFELVAKRAEDVVTSVNRRMELMDEEINILWWARSSMSRTASKPWAELPSVERALRAALEVGAAIRHHPATAGVEALMLSIADIDSQEVATLSQVAQVAKETGLLPAPSGRHQLLPISSAASIQKEFAGDPSVAAGVIKNLGVDPDKEFGLKIVAEQTLLEFSLLTLLG